MILPQLMGILNATPDSFYDQGRWSQQELAIQRGVEMAQQGADWIDIGGESTRPGAAAVPLEEELRRVLPIIQALRQQISQPLSIDTMKPEVAEAALAAGAGLINDVSGFRQPAMRRLAAEAGVPICVMHMRETPATMQLNPSYPEGIVPFLVEWFQRRIDELLQAGVREEQIILDPGIGFGKTVADNIEILHNLHRIKDLGFPVLVGLSRKSFLGKILNKPPDQLLLATVTANLLAIFLNQGVHYLRVHDVAEHREAIDLIHSLNKGH